MILGCIGHGANDNGVDSGGYSTVPFMNIVSSCTESMDYDVYTKLLT